MLRLNFIQVFYLHPHKLHYYNIEDIEMHDQLIPVRFQHAVTLPNGIKNNVNQKTFIPLFAAKFFNEHCVRCDKIHINTINQFINNPNSFNMQNKYFFRLHQNMKQHFVKRMRIFSKFIYKECFCESELVYLDRVEKSIIMESRRNYNLFNK